MRLIDEEALMEDIQKTITEQSGTIDWLNLIKRQPTAFFVDKVVDVIDKDEEWIFDSDDCKRRIIQIVRAGGKD